MPGQSRPGEREPAAPSDPRVARPSHPSRRRFMQSVLLAAGAGALPLPRGQTDARSIPMSSPPAMPPFVPAQPVNLYINGRQYQLSLEPRTTLLDTLREVIGLSGTKKGCDRGQCGACTVLVDGRRINSCQTLAIMQEGKEITTVEGLARGDELH